MKFQIFAESYQYFQMKSFTQGATRSNYSYIIISVKKKLIHNSQLLGNAGGL